MTKIKWPKFLTVKRTILIVLLVLVASLLLYYFLGGYKQSTLDSNTMPFIDGLNEAYSKNDKNASADLLLQNANFTSYTQYVEGESVKRADALTQQKQQVLAGIESLTFADIVADYNDDGKLNGKINEVIDSLTTIDTKLALETKLNNFIQEAGASSEDVIKNKVKPALTVIQNGLGTYPNDSEYLLNLLKQEYVKVLENSNFKFYFNYITSTFKIEGLDEAGNVVTVWYSNPDGTDSNTNNTATIYKQLSPIVIKYFTPSGALIEYSAYEYSITDNYGSASSPEPVTPDFWFKVDEKNNSIQVYYRIAKKGLNFSDFPKYLSEERFAELMERSRYNIENEYNVIDELYGNGDLNGLYEKYIKEKLDTSKVENKFIPHYNEFEIKIGIATYAYTSYLLKNITDLDVLKAIANESIELNDAKYGPKFREDKDGNKYENPVAIEQRETAKKLLTTKSNKLATDEEKIALYVDSILSQRNTVVAAYNSIAKIDNSGVLISEEITDFTIKGLIEEIYAEGSLDQIRDLAKEFYYVEFGFDSYDETAFKVLYSEEPAKDADNNTIYKEDGNPKVNYVTTPYDKNMTKYTKYSLQQIFYRLCYTSADLEQDLQAHNVEILTSEASFAVAVEYKLTENGLSATIINNSIYESNSEDYPIYAIDLLPYFTSVKCDVNGIETNGEMLIPDGSGAVINLNNGKVNDVQYSKRVYSSDLVFPTKTKSIVTQDILLPYLAITKETTVGSGDPVSNSAYTMLLKGSNGASQLIANANVSKFADSYNKVYFTATYRESQIVQIGTGYYASNVLRKTENITKVDCTVDYYLYGGNNLSYSEIAKEYQKILLAEGILSNDNKDTTKETVLNAEYLGIYDFKTNFAGIVYDAYDTLTTYEQALKITQDLKSWGAHKINIQYLGWRDGGLIKETFNDMSFGNRLGSKNDFNNMMDYFDNNQTTLYPTVSFLEINKYEQLFGKSKYSARDVSSEFAEKYPYDLAGNIYDKTQRAIYMLSPKYFEAFATQLAENFRAKNPRLESMSFEQLGSKIVGDYERRKEFFRYSSVQEQIRVFEILAENDIKDLSLTSPYEFAIPYASNITELPYEATQYSVFDYSIPFYQLVVSGYKDYSGTIINANDEKGLNNHIMNILETGSNVQFTFSYDSSDKLIQTDYNYYYYTQYSDWKNEVSKTLSILDKIQLHEYVLQSHDIYNGHLNVFKVVYSNGTDSFSIVFNYTDKQIALDNEYTFINVSAENPFSTKGATLAPWTCAISKEVL